MVEPLPSPNGWAAPGGLANRWSTGRPLRISRPGRPLRDMPRREKSRADDAWRLSAAPLGSPNPVAELAATWIVSRIGMISSTGATSSKKRRPVEGSLPISGETAPDRARTQPTVSVVRIAVDFWSSGSTRSINRTGVMAMTFTLQAMRKRDATHGLACRYSRSTRRSPRIASSRLHACRETGA